MFSSSPLETSSLEGKQIALGEDIQSSISQILSSCPSNTYVVVKQPGVDASDFQRESVVPFLSTWFSQTDGKGAVSSVAVPQVRGQIDADMVSGMLEKKCKAKPMRVVRSDDVSIDMTSPKVLTLDFASLSPSEERVSMLSEHDALLGGVLSIIGTDSYTVIYTSTPPSEMELSDMPHPDHTYEMDDAFQDSLHMELKRDVDSEEGNTTWDSNLPLFEKYQFFSPGIFMAGIVFILFFLLLYVAVSAVSSVSVSYFAFSKEMGPSAQKKQ